jgi:PRTRC genetic system protein A
MALCPKVYPKTSDLVDPGGSAYYLVAENGVFLVKQAGLFTSVTRARTVAGLQKQAPSLSLLFPRLPRRLVEQVYGFFRLAYERFDGEAVVLLYYSSERGEFHADAPPQWLTRRWTCRGWRTEGRVEYRAPPRPEGFLKLGDAHSHGGSAAFFSGLDDRDDREDGLRIVMGRLDRPRPEVRVSFVANGTRFRVRPRQVLESFNDAVPPPKEWIRRVTCRYEDDGRAGGSGRAHVWR